MTEVDKTIQQAVDRLLLEQGAYSPLELLLAEGRLLYADYESWRAGESEYLDEFLFGDVQQSREFLGQGAAYALDLGLIAETFSYAKWGGSEDRKLRFSPDTQFDRLFHTRYHKSAEIPQLDLFMDATGVTLVNGICVALKERDTAEARRLLERLFDADPGNSQIGDLELLVRAAEDLCHPVENVTAHLHTLQQELSPLASDLLGSGSRDFLAPFWQRLINALQDAPFDAEKPEMHASYPAMQLEAWGQVQRSIELESAWTEQPLLLRRYAQASGRLQQNERAACCWFRLCWEFPHQADAIGREAEPVWRHRWQRFLGLEPELANQDFPAWSLLEQPVLASRLADEDCLNEVEVPEDYLVTADLVVAGAAAVPVADQIADRKRLKELNPDLFTHYLGRFARV